MSEYTQYFVIQSDSESDVKNKLNSHKIISIVDSDKDDYGFAEEFKRHGYIKWIVVAAPADGGFDSLGRFVYSDQFDNLCRLFDVFFYFFQDENLVDWLLKLKYYDRIIIKKLYQNELIEFTEDEKQVLSLCFLEDFNTFKKYLKPNKAWMFLNSIGVPYLEMNDQDKISKSIQRDSMFSFLADEIN